MFCPKCGTKLDKKSEFCSECGYSLANEQSSPLATTNTNMQEGSTFGWGVLGFFFPIVGLILFIVWKTEKAKASKSAGIGALVGTILSVVFYIIYFIFIFVMIGQESGIYY